MAFRFDAKNMFLTYPRCPIPKEAMLEKLLDLLGRDNDARCVVGHEHHQDGSSHLHAFYSSSKKRCVKNARFWDVQSEGQEYHPNVRAPRSDEKVKDYVTKMNDYCVYPADWDPTSEPAKKGKWDVAAAKLKAGSSVRDVFADLPGFVLCNLKKLQEAEAWLRISEAQAGKPGKQAFLIWDLKLDSPLRLVSGFQDAWKILRSTIANEAFGQKQLYIHGPTGIGKTHFMQLLAQVLRVFLIPQEDFYDLYEDSQYDISLFEEFKSQKPIQWLNQWMDGAMMNVRKKGSQTIKLKPLGTIFLSNFDPLSDQIYPNMQESISIGTFRRRLNVISATQDLMHALSAALEMFQKEWAIAQAPAVPALGPVLPAILNIREQNAPAPTAGVRERTQEEVAIALTLTELNQ